MAVNLAHASARVVPGISPPENWTLGVQILDSTRRVYMRRSSKLGFKKSFTKISETSVAVRAINGRTPPYDNNVSMFDPKAVEDSSMKRRSSEKLETVKNPVPLHELRQGGFVENQLLYRQKFVIRSYEVGADKATSIATMFSFFQEVSLCHVHLMGIAGDGFGATKAMNSLGLIWVVAKMHVKVESFPKWPDVIEIDSWIARAGKIGMRRDWIVRRYETNEVLVRATSTWCMMHSATRRICKMPDAAQAELAPFFVDDRFVFQQRNILSKRITKLDNLTAKNLSPNLKSSRSIKAPDVFRADLDVNQHVSNLKYISWILQSVLEEHQETYNLKSMTLEYRRECQSKTIVESITSSMTTLEEDQKVAHRVPDSILAENSGNLFFDRELSSCEMIHLLRTQDAEQGEIVRARTTWQSKSSSASITEGEP